MFEYGSFKRLFSPRSILIAGVKSDPQNCCYALLRCLLESSKNMDAFIAYSDASIFPGLRVFQNLSEIPQVPDVAYYLGELEELEQFVKLCGAKKIPFIVITGLPGSLIENKDLNADRIIETAKKFNIRLLGPDSQGVTNFTDPSPLALFPLPETSGNRVGGTALISQSPAFAFSGYTIAAERSVGLRYIVTTGAEIDLDMVDLGRAILDDTDLRLIVFYFEHIERGRRFLSFVEEAREKNIAIAVLKAGRYNKNSCPEKVPTVVLGDENRIWESALMQYGVIEIIDVNEIAGLSYLFDGPARPRGNSLGILSYSRGAGLLMSDRCNEKGLYTELGIHEKMENCRIEEGPMAVSNEDSNETGRGQLPGFSRFQEELHEMEISSDIDIIVVIFSAVLPGDLFKYADAVTESSTSAEKPLVCVWLPGRPDKVPEMKGLRDRGVPVYASISACARALESFVRWSCFRGEQKPWCLLDVSIPAIEFEEDLTEYSAKKLLSELGISITSEKLCRTLDEALQAAEEIGYPVALKVMSPDIIRKSRARVVALDLNNGEKVRNAYGRTLERASKSTPGAKITGVLVQEMLQDGMECMISARRDDVFGPMISVGLGGIYVEFLDDYSTRLAPVSMENAAEMIDELKGSPLLKGVWGRKGLDTASLASMVSRLSNIICLHEDIREININPVFVRQDDVIVVDAFIVRR